MIGSRSSLLITFLYASIPNLFVTRPCILFVTSMVVKNCVEETGCH